MKPTKTQPTPEERCCPKCRSVEFWVTAEGIARRLSSGATVHNQDCLYCATCNYECTGLVLSSTLAKRRKAAAPVPNAEVTKALDALLDAQSDWPSVAPEASSEDEFLWLSGGLTSVGNLVWAYHQQTAPKPTFKHGKKSNHRCIKATQKKARRKSR